MSVVITRTATVGADGAVFPLPGAPTEPVRIDAMGLISHRRERLLASDERYRFVSAISTLDTTKALA
ncbi:hypothetical protein BF93_05645 [Brachybacterium phenoliresistens]|uniref:Uncharacterized protein n=1 Tax=Brachybacterium phenoliresistens TaxID=396014 RepID=Z9JXS0_9MICO|nr:hypothetical protein [Brachybacterium phenoliresistens]EWS82964.1 hypothetical protein BF93_05645 [Brachybacterium phenoliresistens]